MSTLNIRRAGRKRKYRHDGTPIWSKRTIDGPGIWVSCLKGKEKQTIGELYDLFDSVAAEIWPEESDESDVEDTTAAPAEGISENLPSTSKPAGELSIEEQLAKEIATMKEPRRDRQRFANCTTNTPCVVFIGCKAPVDPVELVQRHVRSVENTGISQTRYVQRMIPSSDTCVANLPEVIALCRRMIVPFFEKERQVPQTYRIELRIRNHTTISRPELIQEIAKCVPPSYKVNLEKPSFFILVEVFKSVCGMSIVDDYYKYQKYNVMILAQSKDGNREIPEGRVAKKPRTEKPQDSKEDVEQNLN